MDHSFKAGKPLLSAVLLAVFSVFAFAAVTLAWFFSNRSVSGGNLSMNLSITPNLVIAKTEAEMQNLVLTEAALFTSFQGNASSLSAATHNEDSPTGLVYNTNPKVVSAQTGLEGSEALTFAHAENTENRLFYEDFEVYVASADKVWTNRVLSAELDWSQVGQVQNDGTQTLPDFFKAASVDFYTGSVSKDNYKGTLNLAKHDLQGNPVSTVVLYTGDIPLNTGTPIHLTMRVYFDGALYEQTDTGRYAYLRRDTVNLANVSLTVSLSVKEVNASN